MASPIFPLRGSLGILIDSMDTRLNRFAKYREKIKKLPNDAFTDEGKFASTLDIKEMRSLSNVGYSAGAISYPSKEDSRNQLDLTPDEERKSPYSYYLSKKKVAWLVKIIAALVVAGGLVAFYFFFVIGF